MKNTAAGLLATLGLLTTGSLTTRAQNVGVNTSSPRTALDVHGSIRTDSAFTITPVSRAAAAALSFPARSTSAIVITASPGTQANAIILNGTPREGQWLSIRNQDGDPATVAGFSVAAGAVVQLVYLGGAWKLASAPDNLGSHTASQNLNLGAHKLVGNGGSSGLAISSSGALSLSTGAAVNEFSTDGTLAGSSDAALPTEKAVKTYVDTRLAALPADSDGQQLSVSSSTTSRTLSISGGNSITFSVADNDNSATNEAQTLSKAGSTVTLTAAGGAGGGSFTDSDSQQLSAATTAATSTTAALTTISLSNGGSATVPGDNLGTHLASQNLRLNGNWLSNDGGSEGLRIDNSGKVGIGTATPSASFDVADGEVRLPGGGSGTTHFNFASDGQNYIRGTTVLADAGGSVGIGTSTPGAKLHVLGGNIAFEYGQGLVVAPASNWPNGTHELLRVDGNVNGNDRVRLFTPGQYSASAKLTLLSNGNVGIDAELPLSRLSISPSTEEAKITLWDGGSASSHLGFGVSASQLNYHVAPGNSHVFYAGGKNGNGTELLRIHGNGKVGVGTSNPTTLLANTSNNIIAADSYGSAATSLSWETNAVGYTAQLYNAGSGLGSGGLAVKVAGPNVGALDVSQHASVGTAGNSLFHVHSNGNVGIGTVTPTARLEVASGEVRLPGGGGSSTHFNYAGDNKNYIRGSTIIGDQSGNTVSIGPGGSALTRIVKATVTADVPAIAGGFFADVDFTVTGAQPGGAVSVSPQNDFAVRGCSIASARVVAANTVRVRFQSVLGAADIAAQEYYILVVN